MLRDPALHAVIIRDMIAADLPAVLSINNAAVPAMNPLDEISLGWLVHHAAYARVALTDGVTRGFLLGLGPGTAYASSNYRWFSERYPSFLYIDRIAIARDARRLGLGSALYEDIAAFASGRWDCLLAEVNEVPPNAESVVFHERHGFERVGTLEHGYEGAHASRVMMLRRELRLLARP